MGLAAEVLPVVCILTLVTYMVSRIAIERAPNCLEVEHKEVLVLFHQMEYVNAQLFVIMGKGAEVAEIAVYRR